jgi:hypothetical protein
MHRRTFEKSELFWGRQRPIICEDSDQNRDFPTSADKPVTFSDLAKILSAADHDVQVF